MIPSRRAFLHAIASTRLASVFADVSRAAPAAAPPGGALPAAELGPLSLEALASLERRSGGHLGVSVIDGSGAERAQHRGDEHFPMCSTFKVLAAAAVLARVDRGLERLERPLELHPADLLEYAPVARTRAAVGSRSRRRARRRSRSATTRPRTCCSRASAALLASPRSSARSATRARGSTVTSPA